jgi:membrane protein
LKSSKCHDLDAAGAGEIPSGAAFGSVLGLMAFFYFFARLTLFCAAWIATAEYKDDRRMPGKAHD